MPLLVISVRSICTPGMAFKGKKQNISFPHGDFSQAALAVCSDPPEPPSGGAVCLGITPAFGLSHSPGQVEALLGSPCTRRG